MNVEDTRLGVAEYVVEKLGVDTIELKWGQGAKCIGGEIKVDSLERALELQKRGYIVTPDPSDPAIQAAFKDGAIKQFERHSRLGFVDEEGFLAEVPAAARPRLQARHPQDRRLPPARAGHGPQVGQRRQDRPAHHRRRPRRYRHEPVANDGGVGHAHLLPPVRGHRVRRASWPRSGKRVPDIAIAGGFSAEDHIFKVLALGAPYAKAVCMGRALMIPGMVGKNIGIWMNNGGLPNTVGQYGTTPEEIFVCWEEVADVVGKDEMKNIPLGAVGFFSYVQKLSVGLQQLMAGARSFSLPAINREDLMSLTEECAKVTGIPYLMDAYREEAEAILNS